MSDYDTLTRRDLTNPLHLPVTTSTGLNPVHEARDDDKLAALIADMETNGWVGAPLIVTGDQALTGAHRYEAAIESDLAVYQGVPVIEMVDLCDHYDINWLQTLDEWDGDSLEAARHICYSGQIPQDILDAYGLDLH